MDRRAFLRGLAATTAAVPIAKLAPAVVDGWTPGVMYEVGDVARMEVSAVLRELAEVQARMIDQWGVTAEALVPPRLRWR